MSTKCYNEYRKKRTTLLKTRKEKIMTKKNALEVAIAALAIDPKNDEVVETLNKMVEQLEKSRTPMSDEKKAELNAKRKAETAKARAELLEKVVPVLSKYLDTDRTAKELFETAQAELPADFSWQKVQNILIREMAPSLIKTEAKGKPNTYRLA